MVDGTDRYATKVALTVITGLLGITKNPMIAAGGEDEPAISSVVVIALELRPRRQLLCVSGISFQLVAQPPL